MLSHRVADYMQYATANLEQLHADGRGDCVLCMADLRAGDVTVSVPDAQGLTAVCPHCGADAIVPASVLACLSRAERLEQLWAWHVAGVATD